VYIECVSAKIISDPLIFAMKNEGRKPDKNTSLRRLEVMQRNLD
jgi:hypothetical protein